MLKSTITLIITGNVIYTSYFIERLPKILDGFDILQKIRKRYFLLLYLPSFLQLVVVLQTDFPSVQANKINVITIYQDLHCAF